MLPITYVIALNLFGQENDASEPNRISRLHNRLNSSSSNSSTRVSNIKRNTLGSSGTISSHDMGISGIIRESNGNLTPEAKTVAKAAACHTVGAGICASVAATSYAHKKLSESNTFESHSKSTN